MVGSSTSFLFIRSVIVFDDWEFKRTIQAPVNLCWCHPLIVHDRGGDSDVLGHLVKDTIIPHEFLIPDLIAQDAITPFTLTRTSHHQPRPKNDA